MTDNTQKPKKNTLWGGRFEGGVSDIMEKINASIDFDRITKNGRFTYYWTMGSNEYTSSTELTKAGCIVPRQSL